MDINVYPELSMKSLQETAPGELVQVQLNPAPVLALVGCEEGEGKASERVLILVTALEGRFSPPKFINVSSDEHWVLSYGKLYQFNLDHKVEEFDLGGRRFWDANGIILISDTAMLMRVSPIGPNFSGSLFYDIRTGRIVAQPDMSHIAYIRKWDLCLAPRVDSGRKMETPLVHFELAAPKQ